MLWVMLPALPLVSRDVGHCLQRMLRHTAMEWEHIDHWVEVMRHNQHPTTCAWHSSPARSISEPELEKDPIWSCAVFSTGQFGVTSSDRSTKPLCLSNILSVFFQGLTKSRRQRACVTWHSWDPNSSSWTRPAGFLKHQTLTKRTTIEERLKRDIGG